jgi:hypothetical protein
LALGINNPFQEKSLPQIRRLRALQHTTADIG